MSRNTGDQPRSCFCGRTRREFLWQTGAGFTSLALTGMLSRDGCEAGPSVFRIDREKENLQWHVVGNIGAMAS